MFFRKIMSHPLASATLAGGAGGAAYGAASELLLPCQSCTPDDPTALEMIAGYSRTGMILSPLVYGIFGSKSRVFYASSMFFLTAVADISAVMKLEREQKKNGPR